MNTEHVKYIIEKFNLNGQQITVGCNSFLNRAIYFDNYRKLSVQQLEIMKSRDMYCIHAPEEGVTSWVLFIGLSQQLSTKIVEEMKSTEILFI